MVRVLRRGEDILLPEAPYRQVGWACITTRDEGPPFPTYTTSWVPPCHSPSPTVDLRPRLTEYTILPGRPHLSSVEMANGMLFLSAIDPLKVATYVEWCLYGMYLPLFCGTFYVLVMKEKNISNVCLLVATTAMYVVATLNVVVNLLFDLASDANLEAIVHGRSDVEQCIVNIQYDQVISAQTIQDCLDLGSSSLQDFHALEDSWGSFSTVLATFSFVLGDAIVVWRAWVIWEKSFRIIIGPVILLLGTLAVALVQNILGIPPLNASLADQSYYMVYTGTVALTLCTNAVATGLVGYRAWLHHRSFSLYRIRVGRDRTQAALMLLIESGVLYCGLWITYLVLITTTGPVIDGYTGGISPPLVLGRLIPQLVGMYPTLVIVLCAVRRSYADIVVASNVDIIPPANPAEYSTSHGIARRPPGRRSRSLYSWEVGGDRNTPNTAPKRNSISPPSNSTPSFVDIRASFDIERGSHLVIGEKPLPRRPGSSEIPMFLMLELKEDGRE